ncbi:MAG: type II restriction endonuclease [Thermoguttaceae bacterium]
MKKNHFKSALQQLATTLSGHVSTSDKQWTVKGFIDVFRNIYTISTDTKIVSKILEIHLFPLLLQFAEENNFHIVLAEHQNYYPDLSFVSDKKPSLKYAVDLKTTYRLPTNPEYCNGFTLGSHGNYFKERDKRKNIQFPYNEYAGHFCLGAIYSRSDATHLDETRIHKWDDLKSIVSVISDIQFFASEKWEIASDLQGSSNTANIGSIVYIPDILAGNGIFKNLGEKWFDDYWMNYGEITITKKGKQCKITKLVDFLEYRGETSEAANPVKRSIKSTTRREKNA